MPFSEGIALARSAYRGDTDAPDEATAAWFRDKESMGLSLLVAVVVNSPPTGTPLLPPPGAVPLLP
jgi:hypothetical protein